MEALATNIEQITIQNVNKTKQECLAVIMAELLDRRSRQVSQTPGVDRLVEPFSCVGVFFLVLEKWQHSEYSV